MTNVLNSLMSGGYTPDIDMESNWVPDIDCQYDVYWQSEGCVYHECFTVFEYDDESLVFAKACEFAKEHDTLVFFREPDFSYFDPISGEEIHTPHLGSGIDHYILQQRTVERIFTPVDTDELPF